MRKQRLVFAYQFPSPSPVTKSWQLRSQCGHGGWSRKMTSQSQVPEHQPFKYGRPVGKTMGRDTKWLGEQYSSLLMSLSVKEEMCLEDET